MDRKVVSVRVPEEVADWLDEYAKARGASRAEVIESALAGFKDDCERGVPELRKLAREQASYTGRVRSAGSGTARSAVWGSGMSGRA
jgi:predicted transcriptional regulator